VQARNPRARIAAVAALANPGDRVQEAIAALRAATSDLRPEVRATACLSLGEIDSAESAEIVALCLDDGDMEVRQNAAIALGTLGRIEGFEPLLQALQTGPADLRFQAATSMVEIDTSRSFDPLMTALADEADPEVLGALALALGAIGDKRCADAIARLLEHEQSRTRLDAGYALAELGDPRGIEVLAAAALASEGSWDAVTALAGLGKVALPALQKLVSDSKAPRTGLILASAAVLRHEPDDAVARSILLGALRASKLELRGLATEQLREVGRQWALPGLRALQRSFRGRKIRDAVDEAIAAIEKRIVTPSIQG
jgi:HEAT repeat protein